MDYLQKLLGDIECHSVSGIEDCFSNGINPNDLYNGKPLIDELTSEYTRSNRFKDCVKAFIVAGLKFDDEAFLAVLSNNTEALQDELIKRPELVDDRYSLRCAYTPLFEVSLLHICAEFNHFSCAKLLVEYGADINAAAGVDEWGFGGQTPIFHTVNQNANQSLDMFHYLLSQSANLQITIPGIIWGKGYPWETLIPAVNPISYAMMGLLPQMHRDEKTIMDIVCKMLHSAYAISYSLNNVPNAYLR
ncbi:ankyrin repeat domain-containing protein [Pedobacter sp.]|uniref:ankyrin repeat domain-containing protein n=1 Tax=Pedobacter sp. TaxID=1411316 RepID=UPI003BAC3FC1